MTTTQVHCRATLGEQKDARQCTRNQPQRPQHKKPIVLWQLRQLLHINNINIYTLLWLSMTSLGKKTTVQFMLVS